VLSEIRDDVAILTIDQPGRGVNTLSGALLRELGSQLDDIEQTAGIRGMVIRSGKPGQFVAGADLREIADLIAGPSEALAALFQLGHQIFGRIAGARFPSAAVIDGPCLGGGLELALACDARIASDSVATVLGFPEVTLGLIPAWGGTQRLPRLVGIAHALELIAGGESLATERAKEIGLVDRIVAPGDLVDAALALLDGLRKEGDGARTRARREAPCGAEMGSNPKPGNRPDEESMEDRATLLARSAARDAIVKGCRVNLAEGLRIESSKAIGVFRTEQARVLVASFFERRKRPRDARS
jgi:3-hydroxyacyl-CoA dehydrogenase/enoyl-CoA hydratase/3-hydroxybutyryl-CoA epimerase/3-hydroxyacyl-CoA dehydrogenase/enoyl-CoA hydratase/3-hydroxybutyryl-CoA epimerase/enoyl-CoA isomerase